MHELSITQGILKICLDEGKKHNVKKVNKLNIKVGELTGLVPKYIEEYFKVVAKGTIAEYAEINIETVPVAIRCNDCGFEGELDKNKYYCPNCNGNAYSITRGRDFYLDNMEVE